MDEYGQARRLGLVDDATHTEVERAREQVVALLQARQGPFAEDWSSWRPDPAWTAPELPADLDQDGVALPPAAGVVRHDPDWGRQFETERQLLAAALPRALAIEHFGSTSVPGLAAKPIIDILVLVPDVAPLATDPSPLAAAGYDHRPRPFTDDPEHLFFAKDTDGRRTHHLHVFTATSPVAEKDRYLRDYLRTHPDAVRRYADAKTACAQRYPFSRARYGEAKRETVDGLIAEARAWWESRQ